VIVNSEDATLARRLYVAVYFEGPWARLAAWLYAIDRRTNELVREVRDDSLRGRLAELCDQMDRRWCESYVRANVNPPRRWRRRKSR
jgi:hypothetical protein